MESPHCLGLGTQLFVIYCATPLTEKILKVVFEGFLTTMQCYLILITPGGGTITQIFVSVSKEGVVCKVWVVCIVTRV